MRRFFRRNHIATTSLLAVFAAAFVGLAFIPGFFMASVVVASILGVGALISLVFGLVLSNLKVTKAAKMIKAAVNAEVVKSIDDHTNNSALEPEAKLTGNQAVLVKNFIAAILDGGENVVKEYAIELAAVTKKMDLSSRAIKAEIDGLKTQASSAPSTMLKAELIQMMKQMIFSDDMRQSIRTIVSSSPQQPVPTFGQAMSSFKQRLEAGRKEVSDFINELADKSLRSGYRRYIAKSVAESAMTEYMDQVVRFVEKNKRELAQELGCTDAEFAIFITALSTPNNEALSVLDNEALSVLESVIKPLMDEQNQLLIMMGLQTAQQATPQTDPTRFTPSNPQVVGAGAFGMYRDADSRQPEDEILSASTRALRNRDISRLTR